MLKLGKKRIPIGYEDFKDIIDNDFYYVDKTMLIYEILTNGSQNNLITRPRRFGKTLNFSMLRYFFDITEKDNSYLFDGLKISEHYGELAGYRNAFPVISLSMKNAKQGSYEGALKSLCGEIREQFDKYSFITEGDKLSVSNKNDFNAILDCREPDALLFNDSIKLLSRCLMQYYGKKSIILIDEYDVPLEDAYFSGYYDKMIIFIRSLLESALKTNPSLGFSVITGCLRISKESIFTGLNNLETNSILSDLYSDSFGFVQAETDELLEYYGVSYKKQEIQQWYDGYTFGNSEVYNPWSVLNQVKVWTKEPGKAPETWWANTSSNNIIKTLVERSNTGTKDIIERLLKGGSVEAYVKETVTYADLTDSNENIWSFLFFTGYLKKQSVRNIGTRKLYTLIIPNMEIHDCYTDIIMGYFEKCVNDINRDELLKALLSRDADGFAKRITELLQKSISYYDNAEQFYHGLVTGLLSGNTYYRPVSNRETGSGRSDLILYQQDSFTNAVILEFKVCRKNEAADTAAAKALRRIDERGYAAEALELGYTNIIKYGIAFKGKLCCAVTESRPPA